MIEWKHGNHPKRMAKQPSNSYSQRRRNADMVARVGKSPRHQLTEQERCMCIEALLSERHAYQVRRAQQKDTDDVGTGGRKQAAKRTTVDMEIAESEGCAPVTETAEAEVVMAIREYRGGERIGGKEGNPLRRRRRWRMRRRLQQGT